MLVYYRKDRLSFKEKLKNFKLFLWKQERREFLGRTKESWCKLCFFYLCFYICLATLFISSVTLHLLTLDDMKPEYYNNYSVMNQQKINCKHIGVSPGLGFRPHINPETSLIRVRSSASSYNHPYNYRQYVDQLDEFLKQFLGEIVHTFGADSPCIDSRNFDYDKAKPCVLVKLNKIYDWIPEAFNSTDPLPIELEPYKDLVRQYPNNIFILCEGENQVDKELIGKIKYFSKTPNKGPGDGELGFLSFDQFPWRIVYGNDLDLTDFYPPAIFVYFSEIETNVLVNVMCKAFAKNIPINTLYQAGSVHFELFIE